MGKKGRTPISFPEQEIVSLYLGGETTVSIAARYGCSRTPINRLLARHGVVRSISDDNARRYKTMDIEARRLQVRDANAAARGRTVSREEILKRALARQGTFCSKNERAVYQALRASGIESIPNFSIDGRSTDLAVVSEKLAIELDGGQWHDTPKKSAYDGTFEELATSLGWRVLRYRGFTLKYPQLIALDIKRICADPSTLCGHRVVRRHVKDLLQVADHSQAAVVMGHKNLRDRVIGAIVRSNQITPSQSADLDRP
ncbi:DUF559 domain-containing protein [Phenylobacterium sp.]|uniref:endonuclease domain-containing protein n=1 Tax=Phenylobacterium sp. TaxID=1871053 RepID=UPI003454A44A